MNRFLLAAALLLAAAAPSAAAIVTETDFTVNGNGVTANPDSDLATATSLGVTTWTANEIVDALGGLHNGDAITMTNPISTAIGAFITISWDGGAFTDTTKTSSVRFVGDELDLAGSGVLHGTGIPTNTLGVLDLSFTQAGGSGDLISGSGSFTATSGGVSSSVPEPSTWAMMIIGFGLMGGFAWRKSAAPRLAGLV
jgi:hypothetical protein